jgi:hypothetical protein
MKKVLDNIIKVCKTIFGYSIMLCLFVGGFTFVGYVVALVLGGNTAELICRCIYKQIFPVMIYASTITVLFGILIMYLSGEKELVASKKK